MCYSNKFLQLKGICEIARKLMETKIYQLIYLLLKLALILPAVTATVERAFSTMKYVNNRSRNRIRDQWMNDYLVTYIEKDVVTEWEINRK